MTDAETLAKIKTGLGITSDYQDDLLQIYIDDVKEFMRDAGVPAGVVSSAAAVGCILRGVADLWTYGSGTAHFSEYFKHRVVQLVYRSGGGASV
jgi:hypothetical protein